MLPVYFRRSPSPPRGFQLGPPPVPKPRPRTPQKLVTDNMFCLSCPPTGLNFMEALNVKPLLGRPGDRDYIGFATLPEQVHRKSVK
ncbi:septin-4-like [Lycorma delicatula]|uniref:septin-4-like n=1 Tax=Lycorma delicatula TaxID=130591 RepID=UPI003F51A987